MTSTSGLTGVEAYDHKVTPVKKVAILLVEMKLYSGQTCAWITKY